MSETIYFDGDVDDPFVEQVLLALVLVAANMEAKLVLGPSPYSLDDPNLDWG
jgi:hypothetical protein